MDCLREVLLMLLLVTWGVVDGLKCACDDCNQTRHTDFCIVDDNGRCYSKLLRLGDSVHRSRHCYQSNNYIHYCGTNTSNLVIECCNEDYCNKNLHPTFPPTTSLNTVSPLVPTNSPTTVPRPTLVTDIMCYQHNAEKPLKPPYCTTKTGSCYRLQRFALNGSVIRERQGCSETCIEDKRKRVYRQCCNTSLCNAFSWQLKPTSTRPSSDKSEILKPPIVSELPSSNKVESVSSKVPISSQSPLSSSIFTTHLISTTHLTTIATTTTIGHLTQTPIISIVSPTLSLSYKSSLFSSPLLIILTVFVCIIYTLLLILLFVLITTLCYKQRKIRTLKSTKSSNKTSFDTLTSGESV